MRVAIVHHWLLRIRGGEKVLEDLCALYPDADIYTLICDPGNISKTFSRHKIHTSFLDKIPNIKEVYPNLLPIYPLAIKNLKLTDYDLVITSDAAIVKGVKVSEKALHICYCHSPPRYLWEMRDVYLKGSGFWKKTVAALTFPWLRSYDYEASQKLDYIIANSGHVKKRIKENYGLDAPVIFPPVADLEFDENIEKEDFYLVLGQLIKYKRPDLAVKAMNEMGRKLVVIGEGIDGKNLKKIAGPNIEFMGWQPDDVVLSYLQKCRALIFPGEEDFGIVPVEAQMVGTPVIAYGVGGATETVIDEKTGVFFNQPDHNSLIKAIKKFEKIEHTFDRQEIRKNALRFERNNFMNNFKSFVEDKMSHR